MKDKVWNVHRPSYMPKYVPRSYKSLSDSGINTAEVLDDTELGVDCNADATTAIPVGTVIRIDNEFMDVTATGTTLTVVRGTHWSTPLAHSTNIDIYKIVKGDCVLDLEGQQDPQSVTIRDMSGYNNHGTITGATWKQTGQGLWYLDFDGIDDSLTCGSIAVPVAAAVEFWLNMDTLVDNQYDRVIVWKDGTREFQIGFSDSVLITAFDGSSSIRWATSGQFVARWNHIWCVRSPLTIYVNGISNPEAGSAFVTPVTNGFFVARWPDGGTTEWLDGKMTLLRAYDTAPVATLPINHYNQERHLFGV